MIFSASLTLGLSAFFLGCAFGCVLCIALAKILGRECLKFRLSLSLVFFSFFVISATAFVLFVREKFDIGLLLSSSSDVVFLLGLFTFGALFSSLWKFVFVPAVLFYLILSFYTSKNVCEKFSDFPSDLPISLDSPDVIVKIRVYKMPTKLLLPVSRFFYELEIQNTNFEENVDSEKKISSGEENSAFQKWIFKDVQESTLKIPDAKFYPALFKLNFDSGFDNYDVSLIRTL